MSSHIKTHTREKIFKCNFCAKAFSLKYDLSGHMKSHTGEKPFIYNFCDKSFTQNQAHRKGGGAFAPPHLLKTVQMFICFILQEIDCT